MSDECMHGTPTEDDCFMCDVERRVSADTVARIVAFLPSCVGMNLREIADAIEREFKP